MTLLQFGSRTTASVDFTRSGLGSVIMSLLSSQSQPHSKPAGVQGFFSPSSGSVEAWSQSRIPVSVPRNDSSSCFFSTCLPDLWQMISKSSFGLPLTLHDIQLHCVLFGAIVKERCIVSRLRLSARIGQPFGGGGVIFRLGSGAVWHLNSIFTCKQLELEQEESNPQTTQWSSFPKALPCQPAAKLRCDASSLALCQAEDFFLPFLSFFFF